MCAYQLSMVDHSRALHNLGDIIKTPYLRPTVGLLEEPKAPIGRKLGVANYQEGDCDLLVKANHHSPGQVLHYEPVLILARTVMAMKM